MNRMDTAWVTLISSLLWSCALVAGLYAVWAYVLSKRWQRGVERAMAAVHGSPRNVDEKPETKIEIAAATTKGEIT